MGWDWECSHHMFYGLQITHINWQTLYEGSQYIDDPSYIRSWLIGELPRSHDFYAIQHRALDDERAAPLVLKIFSSQSSGVLDAYLVVESTLVEYALSKFDPTWIRGNFPPGAKVHAFLVVSDEDRDALGRVAVELARTDEDDDEGPYVRRYGLTFGEPGWFDVTRENSG